MRLLIRPLCRSFWQNGISIDSVSSDLFSSQDLKKRPKKLLLESISDSLPSLSKSSD